MDFVAVDVETANPDSASICQIGLAKYEQGVLSQEWKSYVDPEDYFDEFNVSIHGIDESMVEGAPKFHSLAETLYGFMDSAIVVCHMSFDRVAISRAAQRYGVRVPAGTWLDTAMVARRAWKEFARSGYGLRDVCSALGYDFMHHDALEDAKASAYILLAAMKQTGLDLEGWLARVRQRLDPNAKRSVQAAPDISREGNREGPLYGEVLVFTGALETPRREAADLAAAIGCQVAEGVTKKTTMLVVGDQDARKLAGYEKSAKQGKAEQLIADGIAIHILAESDFNQLVRMYGENS